MRCYNLSLLGLVGLIHFLFRSVNFVLCPVAIFCLASLNWASRPEASGGRSHYKEIASLIEWCSKIVNDLDWLWRSRELGRCEVFLNPVRQQLYVRRIMFTHRSEKRMTVVTKLKDLSRSLTGSQRMAYGMLKIGVGNVLTLLVRLSGIIFLLARQLKSYGWFFIEIWRDR